MFFANLYKQPKRTLSFEFFPPRQEQDLPEAKLDLKTSSVVRLVGASGIAPWTFKVGSVEVSGAAPVIAGLGRRSFLRGTLRLGLLEG
mgnify:CR=1 FL=1